MSNSSLQGLSLALPLTSFGNVLMFLFSVSLAFSIIFLNMSVCVSILLNRALRSENRFMYMLSTCFSLSYMAILAAQADRYHAVVSPFQYLRRMTRNRTVVVICGYWLYAFLIVAVNNLVPLGVARKIMSIGTFVGNIFTVIIMVGLNIRLFIIAKFQLEREPPSVERDTKRSSVYLILVVAMFFLVTWFPIFCHVIVCNFFGLVCFTFKNEGTDPMRILPRVNTALTPILYICGCSPLRATLLTKVWRPCCRRR
ncbi:melanocortin receptor 5-like [Hippoglossus stenolepis]|uniref:melanocortin receptor 5-like n=1 Tax=Hippoglossus stenolepis TaxID=195615 RepID=UPI001FAFA440|nr:melanocortin receptor 5-like [Hippoglossus stenolepis]